MVLKKGKFVLVILLVFSWVFYAEAGGQSEKQEALLDKPTKIKPFTQILPQSGAQQEVEIKLFFPRDGYQNPSNDPNWYYYWKDGSVCGITDSVHYENRGGWGFYRDGENHIHICNAAPTKNTGPETYTNNNGHSITVTGQGIGPHCVAETIAHEFMHKWIYDNWHALIQQAEADGEDDGDDYDDPDDDDIPTIMEKNFMGITTDPEKADTYNMGGNYWRYGDNEIRCRMKELNPGITVDTSKDWAWPGANSTPPYNP